MSKESYMYIGPTIPGIAVKNRTYIGIPEKMKKRIEEDSYFANLVVKTDDLIKARQSMVDPNSVINVSYQQVLKSL
jgi:hypothetical protein|nr:MAG TPA: hypothetical protein [Bacteriophage sp.]